MSVLLVEGFDGQLTATDLKFKWGIFGSITLLPTSGRRASGCGLFTFSSVAQFGIAENTSTIIVGFALNPVSPRTANVDVLELDDGVASNQIRIRLNTDNTISVLRASSTLLGTSTAQLLSGAYSYVEVKTFIDNNVGTVEVLVDNFSILPIGPTDTRGSFVDDQIRTVNFGGSTGAGVRIDDIYICDTNGTVNKDFLGNTRVDTLIPDGDSAIVEFTTDFPATGSHWDKVDESPVDEDTSYVQTSTSGHRDIFNFSALPVHPTASNVLAVLPLGWVKKQQTGEKFIRHLVQPISTIYNQPSQGANAEDWKALQGDILEINPETFLAWLESEVDACNFGLEVV